MNLLKRAVRVISVILPFSIFTSCKPETEKKSSVYQEAKDSIDPNEIQLGPIRHERLSDDLDSRIRAFEEVFREVYPLSHEEWLDGFSRDVTPENEVVIWEDMASAYSRFLATTNLDVEARQEAFSLLLLRSSTANIESNISGLKVLTSEQAMLLLSYYESKPEPLKIEKVEQVVPPKSDRAGR